MVKLLKIEEFAQKIWLGMDWTGCGIGPSYTEMCAEDELAETFIDEVIYPKVTSEEYGNDLMLRFSYIHPETGELLDDRFFRVRVTEVDSFGGKIK